jgi:hypothetical protein
MAKDGCPARIVAKETVLNAGATAHVRHVELTEDALNVKGAEGADSVAVKERKNVANATGTVAWRSRTECKLCQSYIWRSMGGFQMKKHARY